MAQANRIHLIRVVVDDQTSGALKKISREMGEMNRRIGGISTAFKAAAAGAAGWFASMRIGELTTISDSMQLLGDRIAVMSGGQESAAETMRLLGDTATRTKTSIDGLATIYSRLQASTKETGISTSALLRLTEILQNTFRLSGTTTAEATSAAIQLSQGFASGQLRGQELRSVMEQNVAMGGILSKTFGVTRGELYKMAEQGQLTAGKVMLALFESSKDLDSQVNKLGQTFEQTATVSMNKFKLAIYDINKEFDLSGKFAKGVDRAIEKIEILAVAIGLMSTLALPALAKAAKIAGVALFAAFGWVGLTIAGISIAMVYLFDKVSDIRDMFFDAGKAVLAFIEPLDTAIQRFKIFMNDIDRSSGATPFFTNLNSRPIGNMLDRLTEYDNKARKEREEALKKEATGQRDVNKEIKEFTDKLRNSVSSAAEPFEAVLARLNKQYKAGKISVGEYYDKLNKLDMAKLNREFSEGKFDLEKYNSELIKLEQADLANKFSEGSISLEEFNEEIRKSEIRELDNKFAAAKITLEEYNKQLAKLSDLSTITGVLRLGTQQYIDSIGSLANGVADAIENSFTSLENYFTEFIKNGKADFKEFTQSILDDINRIIVRSLIVRPLADSILSAITPVAVSGPGAIGGLGGGATAVGGTANVVQPFAGKLGFGTTSVAMGGGDFSYAPLSGMAAPAAPMSGQAKVIVNINNNTGAEVSQQESVGPSGERILEILIANKVKDGIARGTFDKAMSQAYNLRRQGT